ncbi:MAG: hypothetical protein R2865_16275 [Deinococcales bacterium]
MPVESSEMLMGLWQPLLTNPSLVKHHNDNTHIWAGGEGVLCGAGTSLGVWGFGGPEPPSSPKPSNAITSSASSAIRHRPPCGPPSLRLI